MRSTGTPVTRNTFGVPRMMLRFRGRNVTTDSRDAGNQAAINCSREIAPAFAVTVSSLMDIGPNGTSSGT